MATKWMLMLRFLCQFRGHFPLTRMLLWLGWKAEEQRDKQRYLGCGRNEAAWCFHASRHDDKSISVLERLYPPLPPLTFRVKVQPANHRGQSWWRHNLCTFNGRTQSYRLLNTFEFCFYLFLCPFLLFYNFIIIIIYY